MNKVDTGSRYRWIADILICLCCLALLNACTTAPTYIDVDQAHSLLTKGDSIVVTMKNGEESYASGTFDHWEENRLLFRGGMEVDLSKVGKIELFKQAADQETDQSIALMFIQILLSPLYLLMWLGDIK